MRHQGSQGRAAFAPSRNGGNHKHSQSEARDAFHLCSATMDTGKLYDTTDRMGYVTKILNKYHYLMTSPRYRPYMIEQIKTIGAWKDA
ncbi:DUF2515 family protein [Paraburkholderia sp. J69-1]|uniref:DUF2515 family protein n=1 Tax=unclassified Paraburkholderia TaxID=2615204 RepID=UPI0039EE0916